MYDYEIDTIGVHRIGMLIMRFDFRVAAIDYYILYFAEAYLEPGRISTRELFLCENRQLLAVEHFCIKAPSNMFDWILNTLLLSTCVLSCSKGKGMSKVRIRLNYNSITG